MTACHLIDSPDIELFFYDELDPAERARVSTHLRDCAACRGRLDDLQSIREALAGGPVVDAPPAGDWSGFMRRLDAKVGRVAAPRSLPAILERRGATWSVRQLAALAATLAVVAAGVFMAARSPSHPPDAIARQRGSDSPVVAGGRAPSVPAADTGLNPVGALREVSAEHLERSKLVVLGLATRDPQRTRPDDWEYERELAGSLLPETRLYRLAAQERGMNDVAHVMRDLETVLLEASMSDGSDRQSLERVQRLIARRGLVSKMQMQIVTTSATAGL
jgi:hypothetical protein